MDKFEHSGKCPEATCTSLTSDMTALKACMQVIILQTWTYYQQKVTELFIMMLMIFFKR